MRCDQDIAFRSSARRVRGKGRRSIGLLGGQEREEPVGDSLAKPDTSVSFQQRGRIGYSHVGSLDIIRQRVTLGPSATLQTAQTPLHQSWIGAER